ncbi:acid-sensing ion channel 1A-like [Haliotis rubra]|uniref:acid-sensing ion channel 1A-like n=1 Tax=Haliotis rubra TaxID=36100 RepID=UPI001EE57149|nr:acid-sensing ion channel 1A-like [Haliotis rubra]
MPHGSRRYFNFNDSEIAQVKKAGDSKNLMVLMNTNQDHYTFVANMAAGIKSYETINEPPAKPPLFCALGRLIGLLAPDPADFRRFRTVLYFNFNDSEIAQVKKAGDSKNLMVLMNTNQDHYTFVANMAAGIKVFLHDPSVHPDAGSTIVMVASGFSTYVSMKKYEYVYQPLPYMAFDHVDCVDTTSPKFVNPLKYYSPYTFHHCVMECVQTKAFDQCGCVGPSDPRGGPLCSLTREDSCYKPILDAESSKANFLEGCGCVSECKFDSYTAQVSSSSFPAKVWINHLLKTRGAQDKEAMTENFVVLRVFYDQMMVTTITQQPQYTAASLFSNIGGQMCLCLGASMLTVAEIAEFLVFITLFLLDKCRGRKARNRISNW